MSKIAELKMQTLPVKSIVAAPYNPRKDLKPGDDEYEKIARSIETFGYVDPLVWNKRTKHLVGGHQRFKVLLDRGATHVQVSVVDLNEEEEMALNVGLNKLSGEWDNTKLLELLTQLNDKQFDISLTGFDESELRKMLEHEETNEALAEAANKHEKMEIRPYEHYDYLVFFFKDVRDFVAACEKYGIKKVAAGFSSKHGKLGLGRVLDGKRLLEALPANAVKEPAKAGKPAAKKAGSKSATQGHPSDVQLEPDASTLTQVASNLTQEPELPAHEDLDQ